MIWKPISELVTPDVKRQILCRWDGLNEPLYEVLTIWPDGVLTDRDEDELHEGLPDQYCEIS